MESLKSVKSLTVLQQFKWKLSQKLKVEQLTTYSVLRIHQKRFGAICFMQKYLLGIHDKTKSTQYNGNTNVDMS